MSSVHEKLPDGKFSDFAAVAVTSSKDLGSLMRARRKKLDLKQTDLAGIANTGNRFIVDVENGKPTVQLQKVMDLLDLLGLELTVRPRTGGSQ